MVKSIKNKRILLSPLNWGLGHVARTIPIISQLLLENNEVIICCNAEQEDFYRNYFPKLWFVPFAGYPFKFNGNGNWEKDILKGMFSLTHFLGEEKKQVARLVEKFNPDLIISDQRFGFISPEVKSVIISHQLNLPTSNLSILGKLWNRKLLASFDEIWVPDNDKQELSGKLSKGSFKHKRYLGVCSRFKETHSSFKDSIEYQYLGIVSGPAPYNQMFFDLLLNKFSSLNKRTAIIIPDGVVVPKVQSDTIDLLTGLSHDDFVSYMNKSDCIVSRSGYSTLMDLHQREQKGILIPTPGQREQKYLADYHKNHAFLKFVKEEDFQKMKL